MENIGSMEQGIRNHRAHFQDSSQPMHYQQPQPQPQPQQEQSQHRKQQHRRSNSSGENSSVLLQDSTSQILSDHIPKHSDFTIPTSNKKPTSDSPPPMIDLPVPDKLRHAIIAYHPYGANGNGKGYSNGNGTSNGKRRNGNGRRPVFGSNVGKKYGQLQSRTQLNSDDHLASAIKTEHSEQDILPLHGIQLPKNVSLECDDTDVPSLGPGPQGLRDNPPLMLLNSTSTISSIALGDHSQLVAPSSPPIPSSVPSASSALETTPSRLPAISPLSPYHTRSQSTQHNITPRRLSRPHRNKKMRGSSNSSSLIIEPTPLAHETIHAQSLMLGLAFLAIWSPNNVMAPNLTQMAEDFDMDESERDLYLGSYCALAVGVLSLPISAVIGILTDFYSRKQLFVACVAGGALSSIATALSPNFTCLIIARLLNGGCMSGSVPVAFSLLGDLFSNEERNAASSGLTAMMGLGILAGQVYAGVTGNSRGWAHAFYMSSLLSFVCMIIVMALVREPIRGGKEKVLQEMLKSGTKYDRKLSWGGFLHAMRHNRSNGILMWQGYFSSLPWGIIFVFLNDYLSQEKGFSVPDATFVVMLFGVGCALGGILGGYWGQLLLLRNKAYLPLFMAITTFLGIIPFLALLNSTFPNAHGFLAMFYSVMGGLIASLPSVNVRPCIINVNPPETRGAALTAANLIINLARGTGPSCITLMGAIWNVDRQFSFNVTLIVFWTISSIQLLLLAKYLPEDQDNMEAELAQYAETMKLQQHLSGFIPSDIDTSFEDTNGNGNTNGSELEALMLPTSSSSLPSRNMRMSSASSVDADSSVVSIEERMLSFDDRAARQSFQFVRKGLREVAEEVRHFSEVHHCNMPSTSETIESDDVDADDTIEEDSGITWAIDDEEQVRAQAQQDQNVPTGSSSDDRVQNERSPLLPS